MYRNCFGSLRRSVSRAGTGRPAAALASDPYPRRRPVGRCTTSWFLASTSLTGTFQRSAAAASSIVRAAAPQRRMGSKKCRVLREPSVSWLPNFFSSPGACAMRTRFQSASSSSATIIGMPVLTPCPISERWQTIVTVPSAATDTNASGLSTQPLGMPSAPYFLASCAPPADRYPTASTSPPRAETPCRNRRRLTLATIRGLSTDAAASKRVVRATGALIGFLPASPPPA